MCELSVNLLGVGGWVRGVFTMSLAPRLVTPLFLPKPPGATGAHTLNVGVGAQGDDCDGGDDGEGDDDGVADVDVHDGDDDDGDDGDDDDDDDVDGDDDDRPERLARLPCAWPCPATLCEGLRK